MVALSAALAGWCAPGVVRGQMTTAERVQGAGWWPTKGTPARKDFVGSEACAQCHRHQATQRATPMARTAARAEDSEVLRAHERLTFRTGPYTYEITRNGPQRLYSVTDGARSSTAPLAWAFGVGRIGQTFLFERDGLFQEARASYFETLRGLEFTPARAIEAARDLPEAMGRSIPDTEARRCFGCHTTASTAESVFDPAGLTPGVTCEACHGPGRGHREAMEQARLDEGEALTLNPAKLAPADAVDFCGACHATFWDVKLAGEKGVAALRSQPHRLQSSRCWSSPDSRITCAACHDVHQPLVRDPLAYDARCLACHSADATRTSGDPRGVCKVGNAGCPTCHMPKYDVPEMHYRFTDHMIRIVEPGR
jgi:hypothetical protein